jgi:hypothetical protein
MKRILVIYYTQSGQLKQIIESVLRPMEGMDEIQIDYECLQPDPEYPFPWGKQFFDCFPESVKGIPCKLKPFNVDPKTEYDLIILGYQPWYLSPSIPISAFLKSTEAIKLLQNRNVVTIIGARNMWTRSQEIIKKHLVVLKAKLVGNIVLADRTNNYLAGITIIKWLSKGIKGPSLLLPEAGVSEKDINNAAKFGSVISEAFKNSEYENLQNQLILHKAVWIKYHLTCLEKNGRKIFDIFADYILKKGDSSESKRKGRIRLFKFYLLFVFFGLSPVFSFIFMIKRWVFYPLVQKEINYYKSVKLNIKQVNVSKDS